MKKLLLCLFITALFLLPSSSVSAADLSIGSPCEGNGDCQSNQCENSSQTDPQGKTLAFCVCGELDFSVTTPDDSKDCVEKYQGAESDWTCKDGANLTWDLNYCLNKDYSKTKFPIPTKETGASIETIVDMLLDPSAVTAQMYKEIDNIVATPQPKISIPGLKFSEPKTVEEPSGKYLYIPFLGDYISSIYKYLITVAGIIATAMIIKNAFDWAISAGEAAKITQAKTRIGQSLIGLFIAVSSYFILYMINPNLVEFKNLRVRFVEKREIGELSAEATYSEPDDSDTKTYDKNAMINKAMQAAKANGIDPCLVYATMKKESGGNPWALGHDENYPHGTLGGKCPAVGARSVFLRSGKTSKGQTFTPIAKYSCTDNTNPQKNDDTFVNQPPYYGLDWREGISHGIGLSQQTLKPGKTHTSQCSPADDAKKMSGYPGPCESAACTPNEWCKKVGSTWYTVGELLDPDKNIQSKITLLKGIMKNTQDPATIFEEYNNGKAYVPGAMKYYNKCKSDPAINSTNAASTAADEAKPATGGTGWTASCPSSPHKILAVGDSITAAAYSYIDQLQEGCGGKISFEKIAKVGEQTLWMYNQIKDKQNLQSEGFTDLIILGGVNDIASGVNENQIKTRLSDIYNFGKNQQLKVTAITIIPWKNYSSWIQPYQTITENVNSWIEGQQGNTVDEIIDYYSLAVDPNNPGAAKSGWSKDGLHPSKTGHKALAETIAASL